jgi:hypothetical protein
MGFGSGGGGSGGIAGSNDVALNNPVNTEVLSYDSSTSKWKNATTVTQAAVDAKQDISAKGQANGYASLDGSTLIPRTQLGSGTPDATKVLFGDGTWGVPAAAAAPVQSVAGKTGTVTLVKGDVGLANVDNTADAAKPVSTATQTALDLKAPLASPAFTGTPTGITKAHVGLGNVDNTADSAKPVSSATQTALNAKAATVHTHAAADVTSGVFGVDRLPVASDTAAGVVELATNAEVVTGTSTATVATPAGVKAAVTAALHPVVFVNTLGDIPPGTAVDTLVVVRAA